MKKKFIWILSLFLTFSFVSYSAVQIQLRHDTAANWTANDPTLALGEIGLETDSRRKKIGDGATAWTSLAYTMATSADLAATLSNETGTGLAVFGTAPTITTINLTGGQIAFPAAQSASADANTLDDYEEGIWTPTFFDATVGGHEATYTARQGFYTKVGNKVTVYCYLNIAGTAGMTGGNDGFIRGLPFVGKTLSGAVETTGTLFLYNITFNGVLAAALRSNSAYMRLMENISNGIYDFVTVTEWGTGFVTITITYLI